VNDRLRSRPSPIGQATASPAAELLQENGLLDEAPYLTGEIAARQVGHGTSPCRPCLNSSLNGTRLPEPTSSPAWNPGGRVGPITEAIENTISLAADAALAIMPEFVTDGDDGQGSPGLFSVRPWWATCLQAAHQGFSLGFDGER
jgi:hypothetical protein